MAVEMKQWELVLPAATYTIKYVYDTEECENAWFLSFGTQEIVLDCNGEVWCGDTKIHTNGENGNG